MPAYTYRRTYGPIRMSYEELAHLIDALRSLIWLTDPDDRLDESLALDLGRGASLQFSNGFPVSELESMKRVAVGLEYRHSLSKRAGGAARVSLDFDDVWRRATIEGDDRNRVEVLEALLERTFRGRFRIGGMWKRMAVVALIVIATFIGAGFLNGSRVQPVSGAKGFVAGALMGVLLAAGIILTGMFGKFLRGVVVVPGETSFIRRYAPEIGFLSAVVTLVGAILGWMALK